ncbi:restriction endonuclease subunit S [Mycobacterium intracellulare]|uniref:restriction endonuclease subunit S n=1 Tax=Mycobacterium intracellulare TaxID=1767 RepID=UPI0009BE9171|nr:restriction endonuclease subunit S [Mycobacterium intracellulare]
MIAFPAAWPVHPLGELVDVLDSRRVPVSANERAKRPGDVPYYGATGQVGWIDAAIFDEPLVLVGEDGVQFFVPSKPKSYLIDGLAWVNNHAHVLRPKDSVDRRFLNYYLNAADYRGFANGTTRLKLTQSAMRRIPVPVPPLGEQRRIVDLLEDHLSRLDAATEELSNAGRRVQSLDRSALDTYFAQGKLVPLAELIDEISAGKSFGSSNSPAGEEDWGIIKVSAMTWGEFKPNENKAVSGDRVEPRFEIREGDLLVSRANTADYVGASVLVGPVRPKLLLSDKSLRLTPKAGVNREWLWRALQAPSARAQMTALATGTKDSMRNISQAALRQVRVPKIAEAMQVEALNTYAAVALSASRLRIEIDRSELRLRNLRHALLAAAFSGRLTGSTSTLSGQLEMIGA